MASALTAAWLGAAIAVDQQARVLELDARILSQNDVRIAAGAEGELTKLPVREGTQVAKGDLLATIDDRQALAAVDVAQASLDAAQQRAKDDIEEQYAKAAAQVAYKDLEKSLAANVQAPNAITDIEIQKKKLEVKRADLQAEKAKKDRVIAGKEADVKAAELRAAKVNLERRTILAPFEGEVQELFMHQAEWVNAGDPVLRLVQFDKLYVDAYVSSKQYDPVDVADRPVTVRVTLAAGEQEIAGKVVYVDQTVQPDGDYAVRAEVTNERRNGYWLIRPGLPARMTIHVGQ